MYMYIQFLVFVHPLVRFEEFKSLSMRESRKFSRGGGGGGGGEPPHGKTNNVVSEQV